MKGRDKCFGRAVRTIGSIFAVSSAEADTAAVVGVVLPTFFKELPRASSRAFLFLVSKRGLSFSLPLLFAGVRGLEDGGDKKLLVNFDMSTAIKHLSEIYVNRKHTKMREM